MNFGDRSRVMAPPSTFVGASVAPGTARGAEASAEPEPPLAATATGSRSRGARTGSRSGGASG